MTSRIESECVRTAGLIAIGVVAVGVLVWAGSFPGWPLAAGVMLSVLVIAAVLLLSGSEPPASAVWLRPVGVVLALALAVGGGLAVQTSAQAALLTRFEQSRPAFEAMAQGIGPVPEEEVAHWLPYPGECPEQLGSYRIAECRGFSGGFMFLQQRRAWGDDAGFAYAPNGLPAPEGSQNSLPSSGFTHLDGPWYAWSCSC